jgi:hypothetical protein
MLFPTLPHTLYISSFNLIFQPQQPLYADNTLSIELEFGALSLTPAA